MAAIIVIYAITNDSTWISWGAMAYNYLTIKIEVMLMEPRFSNLIESILEEGLELFGNDLRALVLFGSVARCTARSDSDVDLLFVFENLPRNRRERTDLIVRLEERLDDRLQEMRERGINTCISAIVKTSEEATHLSPVYLDMVEDGIILLDRDKTIEEAFGRLRKILKRDGGRRVWKGQRWYWELKPSVQYGEVIEVE